MQGGLPLVLCRVCAIGSWQIDPPIVSWSFDQKSMYISLTHTGANASKLLSACLVSRSSPVTAYEINAWIRVSPTYCNCSQ
jgi:hypothetical protein